MHARGPWMLRRPTAHGTAHARRSSPCSRPPTPVSPMKSRRFRTLSLGANVGESGKNTGVLGRVFPAVPCTRDRKRTAATGERDRRATAVQAAIGDPFTMRAFIEPSECLPSGPRESRGGVERLRYLLPSRFDAPGCCDASAGTPRPARPPLTSRHEAPVWQHARPPCGPSASPSRPRGSQCRRCASAALGRVHPCPSDIPLWLNSLGS